ncbi:hypothetical protein ACIO8G_34665 [Streptomyces sp. NPDC087219]|uniref:hypothetical protein n=1 Tax=Streptomyces sp. NPDC087219 TaxID=3365770 RepID=UPI003810060A
MGRPENPVDRTVPSRGELADLLRAERHRSGIKNYVQLAAAAGPDAPSPATLKRAASGQHTPSEKTLSAYLGACGSGPDTHRRARRLRVEARAAERGGRKKVFVEGINTTDALLDGLAALHVNHGAPPYEKMRARGGKHALPLSTISRILNRQMLPVYEKQMEAFIKGCDVRDRDHEKWMEAWRRVKQPVSKQPVITTHRRTLAADLETLFRDLDPRSAAIRRRMNRGRVAVQDLLSEVGNVPASELRRNPGIAMAL